MFSFRKKTSKILVILLSLMLVITFTLSNIQDAQAFVGVDDALVIAFLATAAVGAGAVGTYVANSDGTYSGTLHDFANTSLLNMSPTMKQYLTLALGTAYSAGYMELNKVSGLWDYLHQQYINLKSLVPVNTYLDVNSLFQPNTPVYVNSGLGFWYSDPNYITQTGLNIGSYNNAVLSGTNVTFHVHRTFQLNGQTHWIVDSVSVGGISQSGNSKLDSTTLSALQDYINTTYSASLSAGVDVYALPNISSSTATGTYPGDLTVTSGNETTVVNDGTQDRPIAIPKTYTDLNDWSGSTAIPTTGVLSLPAVPSASQTAEADATYAPSTTADWESTIIAAITGALTGLLALPASLPTSINTDPLKLDGTLFTTRFPFSIPWDIKNAILGMGSGSANAPDWVVTFPQTAYSPTFSIDINMSKFDSIIPAIRAGELFLFTMGLLMATRKILGGAT